MQKMLLTGTTAYIWIDKVNWTSKADRMHKDLRLQFGRTSMRIGDVSRSDKERNPKKISKNLQDLSVCRWLDPYFIWSVTRKAIPRTNIHGQRLERCFKSEILELWSDISDISDIFLKAKVIKKKKSNLFHILRCGYCPGLNWNCKNDTEEDKSTTLFSLYPC